MGRTGIYACGESVSRRNSLESVALFSLKQEAPASIGGSTFTVVLPLTQQAPDDVFAAGLVDEGQDDGREEPAGGIGHHEDDEFVMTGKDRVEPSDADAADADEDDDGRRQGIAVAAQGTGHNVDDAIQVHRAANPEKSRRP